MEIFIKSSSRLSLSSSPVRARGVVLLIAMVFLLLLSIIAVTTMRSSIFELLMTGNEQARVEAFQKAQAIVEAIGNTDANYSVQGVTGFMRCSGIHREAAGDCNDVLLVLNEPNLVAVLNNADYTEFDITELYSVEPPPRLSAEMSTGAGGSATFWSTRGLYDDRANRLGESEIMLGSMKIYPGAGQSGQKTISGPGAWVDKATQKPATGS